MLIEHKLYQKMPHLHYLHHKLTIIRKLQREKLNLLLNSTIFQDRCSFAFNKEKILIVFMYHFLVCKMVCSKDYMSKIYVLEQ